MDKLKCYAGHDLLPISGDMARCPSCVDRPLWVRETRGDYKGYYFPANSEDRRRAAEIDPAWRNFDTSCEGQPYVISVTGGYADYHQREEEGIRRLGRAA
jgi:hypothetical protein